MIGNERLKMIKRKMQRVASVAVWMMMLLRLKFCF